MALANEKEIDYGMVERNSRGDYVSVKRIIPNNGKMQSIDIRNYYTADNEEVRPTKQGLRIHEEMLVEVIARVLMAMTTEEKERLLEMFNEQEKANKE